MGSARVRFRGWQMSWLAVALVACADGRPRSSSEFESEFAPHLSAGATLLGVLGDAESSAEAIGRIADLDVLPDGTVVIADDLRNQIFLARPSYSRLEGFGRTGQGPDDFGVLRDIAAIDSHTVAALDVGNMRVTLWDVGKAPPTSRGGFRLPFPVSRICGVAGRLLAAGLYEGMTIHEFAMDGHLVRSFGAPLHPHPLHAQAATEGPLTCLDGRVVQAAGLLPVVSSYTLEGSMESSDTIPGFVQIGLLEAGPGRAGYHENEEYGYHHAWTSANVRGDGLEVFAGTSSPGNGTYEYESYASWTVNATGQVDRGADWSWTVGARRAGLTVFYHNVPFPRVVVWR